MPSSIPSSMATSAFQILAPEITPMVSNENATSRVYSAGPNLRAIEARIAAPKISTMSEKLSPKIDA